MQNTHTEPHYLIGIDLGTTNCTMAYSLLDGDAAHNASIEQFGIPQIVAPGVETERFSLPSCIYYPLVEEQQSQHVGLSWAVDRQFCVGTFAQTRGAELPGRLISSSKSWLCHTGIDCRLPLLPIHAEDGMTKISPLEACVELLRHMRESWNYKQTSLFEEQTILITVPASFDPAARELVIEAAKLAGYPEIILLEEPQAAFYSWLHHHHADWRQGLAVGDCILVVDIGGGTTDFSLITVTDANGDLSLERLAVGSHLLLGGDNIDLALAYLVKGKLEEQGHSIDDWQLQSLIHSCRNAKEAFLSSNPPKSIDIQVQGRGSRLIGGSLKTKLSLEEVLSLVLEGFAPLVSAQEQPAAQRRAGLQQVGLPYVQDARLTAHLAKFLSMTGESTANAIANFVVPKAVLFNGGTTKAIALQERLIAQLNQWAASLGKPDVRVLPEVDYDFAVSRGAVNYGKARVGQAIRIRSGTSRSYYIGVEDAAPAVPGVAAPMKAICIAPFGMEEGTELELPHQEFYLMIGDPVVFRFFSHAVPKLPDGREALMGDVVRSWKKELTELHPIETRLDKIEGDGKIIPVKIRTHVTELGVLEVWCVAADQRKWKLEFDIRS